MKKLFVVTKITTTDGKRHADVAYSITPRNLLLHAFFHLQQKRYPVMEDVPDGAYAMEFSWQHSHIFPGLLFREV